MRTAHTLGRIFATVIVGVGVVGACVAQVEDDESSEEQAGTTMTSTGSAGSAGSGSAIQRCCSIDINTFKTCTTDATGVPANVHTYGPTMNPGYACTGSNTSGYINTASATRCVDPHAADVQPFEPATHEYGYWESDKKVFLLMVPLGAEGVKRCRDAVDGYAVGLGRPPAP